MVPVIAFVAGFYAGILVISLVAASRNRRVRETVTDGGTSFPDDASSIEAKPAQRSAIVDYAE